MEESIPVKIRDGVVRDKNFIFSSWLKGLYYGDSWYSHIDKDSFMRNYHHAIENILATPGIQVKVACLTDDNDVIVGYAVYRDNVLHWVFVKRDWRKIGIAKRLIPGIIDTVTNATRVGLVILKKKKWKFDPFAI